MGILKFTATGHICYFTFIYRINVSEVKNILLFKKVETMKSLNFNL